MQNAKLLLVDEPDVIQALRHVLAEFSQVLAATSEQEALRLAGEAGPDLILLASQLAGHSGLALCRTLKASPATAGIPIVLLTRDEPPEFEAQALALGVADFLSLPPRAPRVLARVRSQIQLKGLNEHLRRLSRVDELTGLANRRAFDEALAAEWKRALRVPAPLSLLQVELDFFAALREALGPEAADRCLASVAKLSGALVHRPGDLAARHGEARFALLLPHTEAEGALTVANNLHAAVQQAAMPHPASPAGPCVSLSIGVTALDAATGEWLALGHYFTEHPLSQTPTESALAQAAEQALQQARQAGHNGVKLCAFDAFLQQASER